MSAAEPSQFPEPAHGPIGDVIHLAQHPSARSRAGARRSDPPSARAYDSSPLQRLAETIEGYFGGRGQTLTDEQTARTYLATLDAVEGVLRSAARGGHLPTEQMQFLQDVLGDLRAVPEAV